MNACRWTFAESADPDTTVEPALERVGLGGPAAAVVEVDDAAGSGDQAVPHGGPHQRRRAAWRRGGLQLQQAGAVLAGA